jgi:tripartite-type tricarboxylate transporter receptor subunit TctC
MRGLSQAALAFGLVFVGALPFAQAQRYPAKTIEIVVSYGAGGSTDLIARAIAQKLQDRLGQSVVVLNKPGASGTIGATQVARAIPDGHTLYAGFTTEMAVVPQLSRSAKYTLDDFEPIAVTGIVPVVLIASKNVKANTVPELLSELKGAPGKYTYGGSLGSPSHILGAWLNRIQNLSVTHIPYRGGAQAVGDVTGGHIDLFYGGVSVAKGAIDAGLVKAIGLVGDVRSSALPNVPTFKEAGVTDFDLDSWTVLLGPKGMPPNVVELLQRETAQALADPQVRASLGAQGVEPSQTQDVRAFLARERAKFGRVVRELAIAMD